MLEVDRVYIDLKTAILDSEPMFLYDWQRGFQKPLRSSGTGYTATWSSRDRYLFPSRWSNGADFFDYQTPAANLAVTLNPVVRFGGSGIDLFLTVTDKNLDFYQLEYAPASSPDSFDALGQPARGIVFGENWGTWIPPAQGTWRIRLTAVDLAGNERSVSRWVTWNGVSDIAGLWPENHHISPVASPGVQDQLVWRYTVLRPAQLLFEITDDSGALIRSIPVGAAQPGPTTTTWDGRDDAGQPVPDGDYRLTFRGAEWPVVVDNTPPAVSFEIDDNGVRPTTDEIDTAGNMDPPIDLDAFGPLQPRLLVRGRSESRAHSLRNPPHRCNRLGAGGGDLVVRDRHDAPNPGKTRCAAEWWSERAGSPGRDGPRRQPFGGRAPPPRGTARRSLRRAAVPRAMPSRASSRTAPMSTRCGMRMD